MKTRVLPLSRRTGKRTVSSRCGARRISRIPSSSPMWSAAASNCAWAAASAPLPGEIARDASPIGESGVLARALRSAVDRAMAGRPLTKPVETNGLFMQGSVTSGAPARAGTSRHVPCSGSRQNMSLEVHEWHMNVRSHSVHERSPAGSARRRRMATVAFAIRRGTRPQELTWPVPPTRSPMSTRSTFTCATCDVSITHHPTFHVGLAFCCAGCAADGPCMCSYDRDDAEPAATGPVRANVASRWPAGVPAARPIVPTRVPDRAPVPVGGPTPALAALRR